MFLAQFPGLWITYQHTCQDKSVCLLTVQCHTNTLTICVCSILVPMIHYRQARPDHIFCLHCACAAYCNHGEFVGMYETNRPMTSVALEIHTLESSLVKSWSTLVAGGNSLGALPGKVPCVALSI